MVQKRKKQEGKPLFLDCTLRDGGYYTNWDFNGALVDTYLKSMEALPVDVIEFGYRSVPKDGYLGEYYYCPRETLGRAKELAPSKKLAIMFNEVDIGVRDARRLLEPVQSTVDIVRLAVKPDRFDEAVRLARAITDMGFSVAFNLMYLSQFIHDEAILKKIPKVNGVVDYFNLVDSYGGMYPHEVRAAAERIAGSLDGVHVGFHGHNNMELAFANSLAALEGGCSIIDGTVTGMGRGAGNLKSELFLVWLAAQKNTKLDFDALGDVAAAFEELQVQHRWGPRLPYMISGAGSLPQKEVMEWMVKRFYSMNSILRALHNRWSGREDNLRLPTAKRGTRRHKKVLLIAGGPNAAHHAPAVAAWIRKHKKDLAVIYVSAKHAHLYADIAVPHIFCVVGDEGYRIESVLSKAPKSGQVILPPYPREMGTYVPKMFKRRAQELADITFVDRYRDSQTAVALQTALNLDAQEVYTIGYDGYAHASGDPKEPLLVRENEHIFDAFTKKHKPITSLTATDYTSLACDSVYSHID